MCVNSNKLRCNSQDEMVSTLGETQVDWGSLIMKFRIGGTAITLHGDPSLTNVSNFEVDDEGVTGKWRSVTGIGKLDS